MNTGRVRLIGDYRKRSFVTSYRCSVCKAVCLITQRVKFPAKFGQEPQRSGIVFLDTTNLAAHLRLNPNDAAPLVRLVGDCPLVACHPSPNRPNLETVEAFGHRTTVGKSIERILGVDDVRLPLVICTI
jgi:hypothetical protein